MPDLHVNSLRYVPRPGEDVSFEKPSPVEFETGEVHFRLADNKLTCEMKTHFASVDEARQAVEPAIRAWEVDADLRWGRSGLQFIFDSADVVDRTPAPPGIVHATAFVGAVGATMTLGSVSVNVSRAQYPAPPPPTFRLGPDAESILARYDGYRNGREPLQSMAYFCLTFLEAKAGSRKDAQEAYRIDLPVLSKMGELTSTRGDSKTARKANALQPLTSVEYAWLEAAVKMLIWRVGDSRGPGALPLITMADLPTL